MLYQVIGSLKAVDSICGMSVLHWHEKIGYMESGGSRSSMLMSGGDTDWGNGVCDNAGHFVGFKMASRSLSVSSPFPLTGFVCVWKSL